MLRPGDVARPAPARTFTTELSWVGSPRTPMSVMTGWLIVIYHRRTFTGWTGSLMGCEQRRKDTEKQGIAFEHTNWIPALSPRFPALGATCGSRPPTIHNGVESLHVAPLCNHAAVKSSL